jgi:hypothetical protein
MNQKLMIDPIIEEIHQTRREISEKFNGDYIAMLDDARRRQAASGRPVWQPNTTNEPSLPGGNGSLSEVDPSPSTTE